MSGTGSPDKEVPAPKKINWTNAAFFTVIAVAYWYILVLGAAAQTNGLPVPDGLVPMNTPGWPASPEDFQPVIDDSYHFFYLSEILGNKDAPYVIPPRLAVFNVVESWIFCLLPVLWNDKKRLPRPVLLGSWLFLGINLTNAFLAPYLALTELRTGTEEDLPKNRIFSGVFGGIAVAVAGYAVQQAAFVATPADWSDFFALARNDRSYFAFLVDPVVLSLFQPLLLARVKGRERMTPVDYVPFVGTIAWLFQGEEQQE